LLTELALSVVCTQTVPAPQVRPAHSHSSVGQEQVVGTARWATSQTVTSAVSRKQVCPSGQAPLASHGFGMGLGEKLPNSKMRSSAGPPPLPVEPPAPAALLPAAPVAPPALVPAAPPALPPAPAALVPAAPVAPPALLPAAPVAPPALPAVPPVPPG